MRDYALISRLRLFSLTLCAAMLLAGMPGCGQNKVAQLRSKLQSSESQLEKSTTLLANRETTISELRKQLIAAQGLDPKRWERAYRPTDLRIASLSGGADYDGKPGDDGVTVYLQPLDRDGDVIKVAGEIRVQLYDLAAQPGRQLIAEYRIPADKSGDAWYGKLMTQHFTIKCPWPSAPPLHTEITIYAVFIDNLTNYVVTAQTTCKISLPGR